MRLKIASRASIGLVLAALAGCSTFASGQTTTSDPTFPPSETVQPARSDQTNATGLFSEDGPKMVHVTSPAKTNGEFVVPDYCKATAAGLRARGDGFLLVVDMAGDIPPVDEPPALPYGVVLLMHEIHLGVFAPKVDTNLGGGYSHVRQYQLPDRPADQKNDLGSGKDVVISSVQVGVRGKEFRIAAPSFGQDSDQISEWGVSVNCVLRHPVDGVYFPSTRIPLGQFKRLPIG
jgi:hypothetical protein